MSVFQPEAYVAAWPSFAHEAWAHVEAAHRRHDSRMARLSELFEHSNTAGQFRTYGYVRQPEHAHGMIGSTGRSFQISAVSDMGSIQEEEVQVNTPILGLTDRPLSETILREVEATESEKA